RKQHSFPTRRSSDLGEREEEHKGKEKEELKFVVRWVSSRTLREASVRGQILRKQISEADADKSLPPAPADYELAVVGTDMTPFRSEEHTSELQSRSD